MLFIRSEYEWVIKHAKQGADRVWRCKKSGKKIQVADVSHITEVFDVKIVRHLNCPHCDSRLLAPAQNTPINTTLLVEVFAV